MSFLVLLISSNCRKRPFLGCGSRKLPKKESKKGSSSQVLQCLSQLASSCSLLVLTGPIAALAGNQTCSLYGHFSVSLDRAVNDITTTNMTEEFLVFILVYHSLKTAC